MRNQDSSNRNALNPKQKSITCLLSNVSNQKLKNIQHDNTSKSYVDIIQDSFPNSRASSEIEYWAVLFLA